MIESTTLNENVSWMQWNLNLVKERKMSSVKVKLDPNDERISNHNVKFTEITNNSTFPFGNLLKIDVQCGFKVLQRKYCSNNESINKNVFKDIIFI